MKRVVDRLQGVLRVLMRLRASLEMDITDDALAEMIDAVVEGIEALGGVVEWEDERIAFVQEYLAQHYGYAAEREEVAAVLEAIDAYEGGGVEFTPDWDDE